ncbi:MAG: efflux RND transporter permease subunit [Spirochaetales bacterium]|nr:efflux RND transporter permease subunit [Spirochaetales bacterium]
MLKGIFNRLVGFLLLSLILLGLGMYLVSRLPVMMYPQTRRPMVSIRISHQGISAIDFQQNYADLIEPRLLGIEHLETIETTYSTDYSSLNLTFDWEIKSEDAKTAVDTAMFNINNTLPEEVRDSYQVRFWENENAGFLVMGIFSPSTPPSRLYPMLKNEVEPKLGKIEDVEEIGFYNIEELNVDITLDHNAMLSYGISIADVSQALQSGFLPQPLGSLQENDERFSIRYKRDAQNLSTVSRLEVKKVGSTSISLDDIAQIDIEYTLPNQVFLIGNNPAVQLTATPIEGGNLTKLTDQLNAVMEDSRRLGLVPDDTEFILYLDPAKYIQRSINNVIQAAIIGGILAILIIFLILGEVKNTLIIALSLPTTIIFSFILMYVFNVSLNMISLGGLALAVGMIVDSTIVVIENIHRRRTEHKEELSLELWKSVVINSTGQVRAPIIASTLTSVLVFLPISFTAPLTNAILGDQARTVVFSLLCSLVVSLTIVPIIAYLIFKGRKNNSINHKSHQGLASFSEPVVNFLINGYKNLVGKLIHHKAVATAFLLGWAAILALTIIFILPVIPKEIISTPTSDRVVVFFSNTNYSSPLDIIEKVMPDLSARIEKTLGPENIKTSFSSLRGRFNQVFVDIKDADFTVKAVEKLQTELLSEGEWYFNILQWDPAALPLPNSFDLQISVFGPDATEKTAILESIQRIINESKLYLRTFTRPSPSLTNELSLTARESTINKFPGLSAASLTSLIRRILSGTASTELSDGTNTVKLSASYPDDLIDSREKLENFLIPWNDQFIPLKHFFDFSTSSGVSQIYSRNGEAAFQIYGFASRETSDAQRAELSRKTVDLLNSQLELPQGYRFLLDDPREEIDSSINTLFIALGISILLIYLLLSFQFNSLRIPVIILVTIPLGIIGVILSLFIFHSVLNLNSLLGTILLSGIVVNNAILMIDFYLLIKKDFENPLDALVHTASLRFKPIIITSFTTIFGMLPIAFGIGTGSNILQPLGIAVSGGLLISTLITLFAVPAILSLTTKSFKSKSIEDNHS